MIGIIEIIEKVDKIDNKGKMDKMDKIDIWQTRKLKKYIYRVRQYFREIEDKEDLHNLL